MIKKVSDEIEGYYIKIPREVVESWGAIEATPFAQLPAMARQLYLDQARQIAAAIHPYKS